MTSPVTPLDLVGLFNAVETDALTSGLFDTVSGHEAKSAPGHGMHYQVWAGEITPVQASGLDTTSVRVVIYGRVLCSMLREPLDLIETDLLYSVDRLMAAYSGQFQLALGNVREIDLLGIHGVPLGAKPGYISIDHTMFRCADITIPIIVNDVWGQMP